MAYFKPTQKIVLLLQIIESRNLNFSVNARQG